MNASAFSDLLGKLPDDMLADAFPNARRFQQAAEETTDHPKKANVLQKKTNPVTSSILRRAGRLQPPLQPVCCLQSDSVH